MTVNTIYGKITASKGVLNEIAMWAIDASIEYDDDGLELLAKNARKVSKTIYDALETIGYYRGRE